MEGRFEGFIRLSKGPIAQKFENHWNNYFFSFVVEHKVNHTKWPQSKTESWDSETQCYGPVWLEKTTSIIISYRQVVNLRFANVQKIEGRSSVWEEPIHSWNIFYSSLLLNVYNTIIHLAGNLEANSFFHKEFSWHYY